MAKHLRVNSYIMLSDFIVRLTCFISISVVTLVFFLFLGLFYPLCKSYGKICFVVLTLWKFACPGQPRWATRVSQIGYIHMAHALSSSMSSSSSSSLFFWAGETQRQIVIRVYNSQDVFLIVYSTFQVQFHMYCLICKKLKVVCEIYIKKYLFLLCWYVLNSMIQTDRFLG